MESPRDRQENEILALKAIFTHELKDMREEDAWNVWRPLELVITLTPQQGSSGQQEVHAHIDLHVICSEQYPEEAPAIKLEKGKGLSSQDITRLQTELETLARELKGEVMIFELAQHVQKFLHPHNKPRFKSFYEEMLSRQEQQQQQQQLIKKQKEDKQRQAIQDEIQRKQEALKEEQRRRRSQIRSVDDDNEAECKNGQHLNHVERNYVRSVSNSSRRSESALDNESSQCTHKALN
ncbi:hypothetical protein L9F63_026426 [Diploptera punctata]|uniref:RWD domain-containing protein n=1 Tax=Diploptera punctata TaxID=6984 RepID=A0AAD8EQS4_DIPPU|nr:hypothetical protein L9F63_026426 [Diploptera punctata]